MQQRDQPHGKIRSKQIDGLRDVKCVPIPGACVEIGVYERITSRIPDSSASLRRSLMTRLARHLLSQQQQPTQHNQTKTNFVTMTATTAAMKAATAPSLQRILHTYRTMMGMISELPESQAKSFRKEIRTKFRAPLDGNDDDKALDDRLREAGEKIAFLRIITPKHAHKNEEGSSGRWVYRDGEAVEGGDTTALGGSRVINGFQGHNMDPCMVKRHNAGLKRAGFQNNLHAKGIF